MFATLSFAVSVTAPIFALVALGWLLRRLGIIDAAFINTASRVAFMVGLPAALFMGLYRLDLGGDAPWGAILVTTLATLLVCALAWQAGRRATTSRRDLGVMVQAAGGNTGLATSIIVWTTCGSVLTLTLWLVVLRAAGLV